MSIVWQRKTPHRWDAPTIALEHVTVTYGKTVALQDVTFRLMAGERVALVGPNGAGKSTLFDVVVGKIKPDRGDVRIYGSGPRGHICIGYVPQRNAIDWSFPVTVRDVVMMGRIGRIGFFRWAGRRDRAVVDQALADVRIEHLADRQIGELSGGQQQRVFLARALAQEAELLLLDEPLTGLDVPSQQMILEILDELHARGISILVATHDLNQAADLFDRVLLLNRRLIADGPPEQVLTASHLTDAYGSHLHLVTGDGETLVLADTCCEGGVAHYERERV